jgi:hypothetical protein
MDAGQPVAQAGGGGTDVHADESARSAVCGTTAARLRSTAGVLTGDDHARMMPSGVL